MVQRLEQEWAASQKQNQQLRQALGRERGCVNAARASFDTEAEVVLSMAYRVLERGRGILHGQSKPTDIDGDVTRSRGTVVSISSGRAVAGGGAGAGAVQVAKRQRQVHRSDRSNRSPLRANALVHPRRIVLPSAVSDSPLILTLGPGRGCGRLKSVQPTVGVIGGTRSGSIVRGGNGCLRLNCPVFPSENTRLTTD